MRATRRGKIFRATVLLVATAFAGSVLESTQARSRPPRADAQTAPAGFELHMHGNDRHYHLASDVGRAELSRDERAGRRKARGLVFNGLRRIDREHPCRSGYSVETKHGRTSCTHGPDPAPEGVDVRVKPSTPELAENAAALPTDAPPALPCYGDGVSGQRVQALYVRAADVPDRFSEIASMIPGWAARVDSVFAQSAKRTGGTRHVRFVTNADCTLNVANVQVSATGDDSLDNTIAELTAMGYNRTDRKYLVWADASRYCGIAEILNDDRPDAGNRNNFGPSFARVDASCWGMGNSVEAHELMHTLGGIQLSAPHSSGGWHCVDENDRMCLADTPAVSLSYPCDPLHEGLFDCGNDDYFHTSPPDGSYLATHWNSANSAFLSAAMPEACSTAGSTSTETKKRKKHRKNRRSRGSDAAVCLPASAFAA